MAELDGFRLTFPDNTVFRATEGVAITHHAEPLYPIDGLRTFVTIYNEYLDSGGQAGRADSNMAGLFFGFGAGVHRMDVTFPGGWEGSTDTWGGSSSGDSPVSKLQTLNRAVTTTRMDSLNPAEFETGEYSTPGKYSPIPVAFGQMDLSFNPDEQTSTFQGQLQLWESIDLSRPVSANARRG